MAALPDRGSRDDLPITPADAARRWLFMHLDSGYTGGRRFSADAEKRWTAYRQEQASTPEQRTPIVSAPFDHPLDIRTDELISEFISAMDSAGIAEQPHIFGTFPTDGGDWLQPMHDVTAEGWYVPTTFGPAPGYVITRTATMYPLSQPRELAQTAVAREPELALPSVSKNPGLAEWTLFLHNCIQEAARDIIDRALCAENIDDRAGIMTVEFISQMRAREIAPTRQTFVHLDQELLDGGMCETDLEAETISGVETDGWLLEPPRDAELFDYTNEPVHRASRSYVITPRAERFLLRQPSSLAKSGAGVPIVCVPSASRHPSVGPLNFDVREDRAEILDRKSVV